MHANSHTQRTNKQIRNRSRLWIKGYHYICEELNGTTFQMFKTRFSRNKLTGVLFRLPKSRWTKCNRWWPEHPYLQTQSISPRTDPVEKGSWYRCQNGHQAGSLVSFVLTAFLLQCHTAIDHTLPLFFLPHSYCPLPQVSFLHLCLLLLWDPPCPTEAVCFQPLIASGTADMCACGYVC